MPTAIMTFVNPGPSTATMAMANKMPGNANMVSINMTMAASTFPR